MKLPETYSEFIKFKLSVSGHPILVIMMHSDVCEEQFDEWIIRNLDWLSNNDLIEVVVRRDKHFRIIPYNTNGEWTIYSDVDGDTHAKLHKAVKSEGKSHGITK